MKTKIYTVVVLSLVCVIIGLGIYWSHYIVESSYNEALTLTQENRYEEAISELKEANSNRNFENDLKRFILYDIKSENEYYKDSWSIYPFILAMQEYTSKKDIGQVIRYLDLIPESYSGDLSKEIKEFKIAIEPEITEHEAEQARRAEEAKIAIEKAHQEFMAELKTKIPYKGMSESNINKTIMGKYHDIDTSSKYGNTKYYWKTNSGDIMLIVTCKEGNVTSINRYGLGYYWTDDIKPIWNGKNPYKNSISKKEKKSDPYDVYDYSDPEDFYYDNYDDFWDYEDAEDYFNEHHN